ncbi:MAG: N-formylglutamate amidohydrolase, partial [Boseongicola sp.]|nr:N-formylglutamate amidohydrolase [Boseongicola sp.]
DWIMALKSCFEELLGPNVTINDPFSGGYITRRHSTEMPWLQLELSRAPFLSNPAKGRIVRAALTALAGRM